MDIKFSFHWSGSPVTAELKEKVEDDIRHEMPGLVDRFPDPPMAFDVSLYLRDPISQLEGEARADGKALVKISYSLTHPCLRNYFYLGHSCSNES